MAVKNKPAASNNNTDRDFEKAKGFLNISVRTKHGDTVRLNSIPLQESNDVQKQLIDWLADPATREERVATLIGKLVLQYNPTRTAEELQLDL